MSGAISSRRVGAITLVFACIVIAAASAIVRTTSLDGPAGFVFFVLIAISIFFIAVGASVTVWRLMAEVLPPRIGTPERLLFAFATFVLVFGCGPLVISSAVMLLAQVQGSAGASGIWALLAVLSSGLVCALAGTIVTVRNVLDRGSSRRGSGDC